MDNSCRIHCRASKDHSLALVNGEVVLADADPSDDRQLWYKDGRYGGGLKHEVGSPAFALVNKATGDALKHSFGYNCPVRAIKFDPGYLDESVLWAEGGDHTDGFRRIHMINNVDYIFDAERGGKSCGGVRDGTRLILYRWNAGENQLWQISPRVDSATHVRISCQSGQDLYITVRDGAAVLAPADRQDETQCWFKSHRNAGHVTDKEGHRSFALVNTATGNALRFSRSNEPVEVVGHCPDTVDVALLWTFSDDLGEGFQFIRNVSDIGIVLEAADGVPECGGARDGTPIIVFPRNDGPNQKWKMVPFLNLIKVGCSAHRSYLSLF